MQAKGTAAATLSQSQRGQFLLQYDSRPFINAFYSLALGPVIESSGLYSWAEVSNPLRTVLFILARNVHHCNSKYANHHKAIDTIESTVIDARDAGSAVTESPAERAFGSDALETIGIQIFGVLLCM
eukprot:gene27912-34698_t